MEFNVLLIAIFTYVMFLIRFNDRIRKLESDLNDLLINNLSYFRTWEIASRGINKIKIKDLSKEIVPNISLKHYNINDIEIIINNDLTKLSLEINKFNFIDLNHNIINNEYYFKIYDNNDISNDIEKIEEIILLLKIINYNLLIDKQNIKNFENLLEYKNAINRVSKNKYLLKD